MTARTSQTDPLRVHEVSCAPFAPGTIGITFCPGKCGPSVYGAPWRRNLGVDLDAITAWGPRMAFSLVQEHELEMLNVPGLGEGFRTRGIEWHHLPIEDLNAPDEAFHALWESSGTAAMQALEAGDKVLVHCRGGLGRAGTVAAVLLMELGMDHSAAVARVRRARAGAVETSAQECYLAQYKPRLVKTVRRCEPDVADSIISWFGELLTPMTGAAGGAVLGALVGDAAGGVLEFMGRKPTQNEACTALLHMPGGGAFRLAPGQFTDDGELTTALLSALRRAQGRWDADCVAHAYCSWSSSHPFDMGNTTGSALGRSEPASGETLAEAVMSRARRFNGDSKANGALMRISPLAVAGMSWPEAALAEAARADARLTHPNVVCQHANAAYVLALRHLIVHPGDAPGALDVAVHYIRLHDEAREVHGWLQDAVEGRLAPVYPQAGFVRHGFTRAFYYLRSSVAYGDAIVQVLAEGGDTDTNACIVGAMLGALHGIQGIPMQSLTRVIECETRGGQERPDAFTIKAVRQELPALIRLAVQGA